MIATAYRNALLADTMGWTDAFIVTATAALASILALPPLYLAKSALGINLMPGPSPLHDLLFWLLG